MIITLKHLALTNCILLVAFSADVLAGKPPPTEASCSKRWKLTSGSAALAFGAFSIDSGSGTVIMSSAGSRTASGDIGLLSSQPATTYVIQVNNALGVACLGFPFTLDWITAPTPLDPAGGVGTSLPLSAFVYEPTIAPTVGDTFPINVAANSGLTLPFNLTLYGTISTTFLQTADDYVSPAFRVGLTQAGTLKRSPNATATATSVVPLSLAELTPMNFGTIAGSSSPSTVVLDTLNSRIATGGAQVLATGPGMSATFQITGTAGLTYSVSFPTSATLENATGQQMIVDTFTNNSLGTLPVGGIESFQVGATINMNTAQPAGLYSTITGGGSPYTMTVNYN